MEFDTPAYIAAETATFIARDARNAMISAENPNNLAKLKIVRVLDAVDFMFNTSGEYVADILPMVSIIRADIATYFATGGFPGGQPMNLSADTAARAGKTTGACAVSDTLLYIGEQLDIIEQNPPA
jgi:hypothetical protein